MTETDRDGRLLWRVVLEHRFFLSLVSAYVGAGVLVDLLGWAPGLARKLSYTYAYLLTPALIWIPMLITLIRERFAVRVDGQRIIGWPGWVLAYRHARRTSLSTERVVSLALVACVIPVFMNLFGGWKAAIPTLHPFAYDVQLAHLDRMVHGQDPWRLFQPWLGRPRITHYLDQSYALWLVFVPAVVVWQGWSADRDARRQFFLTYVLTWILLGTLLATVWSSAGPCFYAQVTDQPGPYAPLLVYLRSVHEQSYTLLSQVGQSVLWRNYTVVDAQPYTRISAMPSLHVAMPILYTLAGWRSHPLLGLAFACYGILIFLGSVHLGWHYAIDGYVSLLLVPLIWGASGRIVRRVGHG